jgi:hypothetical protein
VVKAVILQKMAEDRTSIDRNSRRYSSNLHNKVITGTLMAQRRPISCKTETLTTGNEFRTT